jgi:polysaccharide export outer membrane protein
MFALRPLLCGLLAGSLCMHAMPALAGEPPVAEPPAATARPGYVLAYGDTLTISMFGNDTFKIESQPIRPDGCLNIPLLGEVQAAGLTVPQLSTALHQAYRRYVRDPRLVVNVATFRPLKINVLGLVNKPGTYLVAGSTDLLEGLALAGGLLRERADAQAIELRHANGTREVVNLEGVLAGTQRSVPLGDGDTVIVPEVAGPDWEKLLPTVATALSIVSSMAMISWYLKR